MVEYFVGLYISNIFKVIIFSLLVFLILRRTNFEKFKKITEKYSNYILFSLIFLYIIVFSTLSILKHNNFNTNCYDLASYIQPIYQTLKGNFLYCSHEGKIYLGVHTSFSLLLFVPFYFIYPSPYLILFLQSVILATGAIPVYLIAKEKLKNNTLSLIFSFLYLIYPPLHYINLYDFHPDILVIPSFLFAFYFMQKQDYFKMCIFLLIAFLTKEQMSLITFIFGIYILIFHKKYILGSMISLVSLVWFFTSVFYIIPYFAGGVYQHFSGYNYLGETFSDKIKTIFTQPIFLAKNLLTPVKIGYIILIFLPLCFLSFLSLYILFSFPTFAINLLSNTIQHNSIFFQYTASIIPFLFISAIHGFQKIKIKNFSIFLLSLSLFFSYYFGPSPISKTFWDKNYKLGEFKTLNFYKSVYIPTSRTNILKEAIKKIPENASCSAQTQVCPHLINREKLYMFPNIPEDTNYIVIDKKGNIWPMTHKKEYEDYVKKLLADKRYNVIFERDGVIVLKRKY